MTSPVSRRRFLRAAGVAVTAGVAGCGTSASDAATDTTATATTTTTTTTTATPEPTTTTTTTAEATGPTVAMRTDNEGSYFTPKGLLVEPGTTVTFVNEAGAHGTSAYHPKNDKPLRIPEGAAPWASKTFSESGATFEVTLDTPGVYDYYCPPHEIMGMVGRFVVGEPRGGPGTTPPKELPPAAAESLPSIDAIVEQGSVEGP